MVFGAFIVSLIALFSGGVTTILNMKNYKIKNSPTINWEGYRTKEGEVGIPNYDAKLNFKIAIANPEKMKTLIIILQIENEVHTSKVLVNNAKKTVQLKIPYTFQNPDSKNKLTIFGKSYSEVYFIVENIGEQGNEFEMFKSKLKTYFWFEPKVYRYKNLINKAVLQNNTYIKRREKIQKEKNDLFQKKEHISDIDELAKLTAEIKKLDKTYKNMV